MMQNQIGALRGKPERQGTPDAGIGTGDQRAPPREREETVAHRSRPCGVSSFPATSSEAMSAASKWRMILSLGEVLVAGGDRVIDGAMAVDGRLPVGP